MLGHLAARPSKEWLFRMEEGEPLNYRRWKTEWNCARRALQAVENEPAKYEGRKPVELPHVMTHDLRHFYASALIACGASIKQVQLVLGHASAVITLRIYAHLRPAKRPHPLRHGRLSRRAEERVRGVRRDGPRGGAGQAA
ncbi:tyrosine-type recombinase/integrase [Streptomyces sp. NPDC058653]|uniref:tyrosine-type recombinase/integrase n=1 Tax=Streptomyces sp. NPDC058653 TaxID=3346576 RepID=UPI00364DF101